MSKPAPFRAGLCLLFLSAPVQDSWAAWNSPYSTTRIDFSAHFNECALSTRVVASSGMDSEPDWRETRSAVLHGLSPENSVQSLEDPQPPDDDLEASLSKQDKKRVRELTADITVHDPQIPEEWLRANRQIMRPRKDPLDGREWFVETIRTHSRIPAERWDASPENALLDALGEWELRLVYFPYKHDLAVCSYRDDMDWGYNFVHPSGVRIQIGPNEFSWTPYSKRSLRNLLEEERYQANSHWPYLLRDLWVLRQPGNLEVMLRSDRLRPEDRIGLKGFALIAGTVTSYVHRVEVFRQVVRFEGNTYALTPEMLSRLIVEAERLAREEGSIQLPRRQVKLTARQLLRASIGRATAEALHDIADTWNRIARAYAEDQRNGASFIIKRSTFGQILHGIAGWLFERPGSLNRPAWLSGEPLPIHSVLNILSVGGGPEVLAQALDDIRPALAELGVQTEKLRAFNMDFAFNMLTVGRESLTEIQDATGRSFFPNPVAANAVKTFFPYRDRSFHVVETGNWGSLGEGNVSNPLSPHHGLSRKIHLLLEMRRVLEDGGYAIFTVRNKMPEGLYDALPLFGFRVLSPRQPDLSFKSDALDLLTQGDWRKRQKLQTILRTASYIVAYRDPRLVPLSIPDLIRHPDVLNALNYKDSYRTGEHREIVTGNKTPDMVDVTDLHYGLMRGQHLRPAAVGRHVLETHPDYSLFIPYLRCLQWSMALLGAQDQQKLETLLRLWDEEHVSLVPDSLIDFVYMTVSKSPTRLLTRKPKSDSVKTPKAQLSALPESRVEDHSPRTSKPRVKAKSLLDLYEEENARRLAEGQLSIAEELTPQQSPARWAPQAMDAALIALRRLVGQQRASAVTEDIVRTLADDPTPRAVASVMQKMVHATPAADRVITALQSAGILPSELLNNKASPIPLQPFAHFVEGLFETPAIDADAWAALRVSGPIQTNSLALWERLPTLSWPQRCDALFEWVSDVNRHLLMPAGIVMQATPSLQVGRNQWTVRFASFDPKETESWAMDGEADPILIRRVHQWSSGVPRDNFSAQSGATLWNKETSLPKEVRHTLLLLRSLVHRLSARAYSAWDVDERQRLAQWRPPFWDTQEIAFVEDFLTEGGEGSAFYRRMPLADDLSLGYSPAVKARALANAFVGLHALQRAPASVSALDVLSAAWDIEDDPRIRYVSRVWLLYVLAQQAALENRPPLSDLLKSLNASPWLDDASRHMNALDFEERRTLAHHALLGNFKKTVDIQETGRHLKIEDALTQVFTSVVPSPVEPTVIPASPSSPAPVAASGPQEKSNIDRAVEDLKKAVAGRHRHLITPGLLEMLASDPRREAMARAIQSARGLPPIPADTILAVLRKHGLGAPVQKAAVVPAADAPPVWMNPLFSLAATMFRNGQLDERAWHRVRELLETHLGAMPESVSARLEPAAQAAARSPETGQRGDVAVLLRFLSTLNAEYLVERGYCLYSTVQARSGMLADTKSTLFQIDGESTQRYVTQPSGTAFHVMFIQRGFGPDKDMQRMEMEGVGMLFPHGVGLMMANQYMKNLAFGKKEIQRGGLDSNLKKLINVQSEWMEHVFGTRTLQSMAQVLLQTAIQKNLYVPSALAYGRGVYENADDTKRRRWKIGGVGHAISYVPFAEEATYPDRLIGMIVRNAVPEGSNPRDESSFVSVCQMVTGIFSQLTALHVADEPKAQVLTALLEDLTTRINATSPHDVEARVLLTTLAEVVIRGELIKAGSEFNDHAFLELSRTLKGFSDRTIRAVALDVLTTHFNVKSELHSPSREFHMGTSAPRPQGGMKYYQATLLAEYIESVLRNKKTDPVSFQALMASHWKDIFRTQVEPLGDVINRFAAPAAAEESSSRAIEFVKALNRVLDPLGYLVIVNADTPGAEIPTVTIGHFQRQDNGERIVYTVVTEKPLQRPFYSLPQENLFFMNLHGMMSGLDIQDRISVFPDEIRERLSMWVGDRVGHGAKKNPETIFASEVRFYEKVLALERAWFKRFGPSPTPLSSVLVAQSAIGKKKKDISPDDARRLFVALEAVALAKTPSEYVAENVLHHIFSEQSVLRQTPPVFTALFLSLLADARGFPMPLDALLDGAHEYFLTTLSVPLSRMSEDEYRTWALSMIRDNFQIRAERTADGKIEIVDVTASEAFDKTAALEKAVAELRKLVPKRFEKNVTPSLVERLLVDPTPAIINRTLNRSSLGQIKPDAVLRILRSHGLLNPPAVKKETVKVETPRWAFHLASFFQEALEGKPRSQSWETLQSELEDQVGIIPPGITTLWQRAERAPDDEKRGALQTLMNVLNADSLIPAGYLIHEIFPPSTALVPIIRVNPTPTRQWNTGLSGGSPFFVQGVSWEDGAKITETLEIPGLGILLPNEPVSIEGTVYRAAQGLVNEYEQDLRANKNPELTATLLTAQILLPWYERAYGHLKGDALKTASNEIDQLAVFVGALQRRAITESETFFQPNLYARQRVPLMPFKSFAGVLLGLNLVLFVDNPARACAWLLSTTSGVLAESSPDEAGVSMLDLLRHAVMPRADFSGVRPLEVLLEISTRLMDYSDRELQDWARAALADIVTVQFGSLPGRLVTTTIPLLQTSVLPEPRAGVLNEAIQKRVWEHESAPVHPEWQERILQAFHNKDIEKLGRFADIFNVSLSEGENASPSASPTTTISDEINVVVRNAFEKPAETVKQWFTVLDSLEKRFSEKAPRPVYRALGAFKPGTIQERIQAIHHLLHVLNREYLQTHGYVAVARTMDMGGGPVSLFHDVWDVLRSEEVHVTGLKETIPVIYGGTTVQGTPSMVSMHAGVLLSEHGARRIAESLVHHPFDLLEKAFGPDVSVEALTQARLELERISGIAHYTAMTLSKQLYHGMPASLQSDIRSGGTRLVDTQECVPFAMNALHPESDLNRLFRMTDLSSDIPFARIYKARSIVKIYGLLHALVYAKHPSQTLAWIFAAGQKPQAKEIPPLATLWLLQALLFERDPAYEPTRDEIKNIWHLEHFFKELSDAEIRRLAQAVLTSTFQMELQFTSLETVSLITYKRDFLSTISPEFIGIQLRRFFETQLNRATWSSFVWRRVVANLNYHGVAITPEMQRAVDTLESLAVTVSEHAYFRALFELLYATNIGGLRPLGEVLMAAQGASKKWEVTRLDVEKDIPESYEVHPLGLSIPIGRFRDDPAERMTLFTLSSPFFGIFHNKNTLSPQLENQKQRHQILSVFTQDPVMKKNQDALRKSAVWADAAIARGADSQDFSTKERSIQLGKHMAVMVMSELTKRLYQAMPTASQREVDQHTSPNDVLSANFLATAFVRPGSALHTVSERTLKGHYRNKAYVQFRSHMLIPNVWSTLNAMHHAADIHLFLYILMGDFALVSLKPESQTNPEDAAALYVLSTVLRPGEFVPDDFLDSRRSEQTVGRFGEILQTATEDDLRQAMGQALRDNFFIRTRVSDHTVTIETDADAPVLVRIALAGAWNLTLYQADERAQYEQVVKALVDEYQRQRIPPEELAPGWELGGLTTDEQRLRHERSIRQKRIRTRVLEGDLAPVSEILPTLTGSWPFAYEAARLAHAQRGLPPPRELIHPSDHELFDELARRLTNQFRALRMTAAAIEHADLTESEKYINDIQRVMSAMASVLGNADDLPAQETDRKLLADLVIREALQRIRNSEVEKQNTLPSSYRFVGKAA